MTTTTDSRIGRLFGLTGDHWNRHANPWSVWTRFAVLPLLTLAAWSRVWIGWWAVPAGVAVLAFMMVQPLLSPPPRSTRSWPSKGVLGERIASERSPSDLPPQFGTSRVPTVTIAWQVLGLTILVVGVVRLLLTVAGLAIVQCAKAWFIDRAVLLFEDMKTRDPAYAAWERPAPPAP
jgi:hypothetical protein